jgi:predicted AAA+ superfamily ATPase
VVAGSRQVGKTTLVQQVVAAAGVPVRYASADEPTVRGAGWIAAPSTATAGLAPGEVRVDREFQGRLVESAVGAHLANAAACGTCELLYWRERNHEVDFVARAGRRLVAIEVKSGRRRDALRGMEAFARAFRPAPAAHRRGWDRSGGVSVPSG